MTTFMRIVRIREPISAGCVDTNVLPEAVGGFEDTTLHTPGQPMWWRTFGVVDHWAISTTDPRSGSKHLAGTGGSTSSLRQLALVSGDQTTVNVDTYYSHEAAEGQPWTFSGYYKGPGGDVFASVIFDDAGRPSGTGTVLDFADVTLDAAEDYTPYSVSLVAPAGTAFVRAAFGRLTGASNQDQYDDWQLIGCL